ncbi:Ohr family peroxiredoxin [Microbispora sp. H11081]|uniref:Ohr family peroxiredoxin n=1 Tax=Microbispora sp. H11081 TaxID=2729107 RepID=UPI0014763E81|nr:Ohr family peroxiredoxin [Microbispora sp. H11081]
MSGEVWRSTHLPSDRAPGPDYSGPGVEAELTGRLPETRPERQAAHEDDDAYDDLYTARASSALGKVASDDGMLDVRVKAPDELGGPGGATNPEQLLAAAYASCFHNSLTLVAGRQGVRTVDATVDTSVTLRKRGVADDYRIATDLTVRLPGVEPETARRLVEQAHWECPYSRAFMQGAEVHLHLA